MKEELDEIYRLYAGDVYRYLFSLCRNEHLAQDLLQDVMLKAVTGFDKFRGDSSVKTWLFTIAKNLYLNHVKRADNRNLPIEEEVLRSEDNLEERIMDQSQALHIHRLVHSLDDPYREVFTLRVFAELKFDDIGAVFGKTGNWARVSYYRAKEKILSMMKEDQI
ncbi:RNA polymerase sigma factor [Ruminococcus sp. XPD3002]|uniref:RNA polymerase sigma factor n=1 Tax=Ruminococcus sp. XPD3002 TaxID=1452269 RepID=UPI000919543D|nr:RNA polymerase sigma-70 factor, ECF subfamily [Ruminococcus flavefaciens]HRU97899.1 sigma-70 family RNA polymerase sigma factor [Ruminococcus sp.]